MKERGSSSIAPSYPSRVAREKHILFIHFEETMP